MILDQILTIEVPGERIRANIREIINLNKVIVELTNIPMSKAHDYKQGNFVECELEQGIFGNTWIGKHKMSPVIEEKKEKKDARTRKSYK